MGCQKRSILSNAFHSVVPNINISASVLPGLQNYRVTFKYILYGEENEITLRDEPKVWTAKSNTIITRKVLRSDKFNQGTYKERFQSEDLVIRMEGLLFNSLDVNSPDLDNPKPTEEMACLVDLQNASDIGVSHKILNGVHGIYNLVLKDLSFDHMSSDREQPYKLTFLSDTSNYLLLENIVDNTSPNPSPSIEGSSFSI